MPASIKDFATLKSLRNQLKAQDEARKTAEAERLERERRDKADADLFRRSIGDVSPLPASDKMHTNTARPLPIARQHLADEQAALRESLSDEFNVDSLLDTDGELS